MATPPATEPTQRSLGRSVALGIAVGVGVGAICFFLIAIPFYTLASFEPNGIDRPVVRTGLFKVALPVGLLVGLASGVAAGLWLRRGGTWTVNDGSARYRSR
ncbi:MAG TPA: hypothetical protein VLR27_12145 [Acidimicrobiales bacterium]|nr:hypothetical protein [Acidimicrobiales bacterium]